MKDTTPTPEQLARAKAFWIEYLELCEKYQCQHYNAYGQDSMVGIYDDPCDIMAEDLI